MKFVLLIAFAITLSFTSHASYVESCPDLLKIVAPTSLNLDLSNLPKGKTRVERVRYEKAAAFDRWIKLLPVREAIRAEKKRSGKKTMITKIRFTADDFEGEAVFYFRYLSKEKILVADSFDIPEALKGRGISKYFWKLALEMHPDTQGIYAMLGYDNRTAYETSKKSSNVGRLKDTPFMKALKYFGFDEIVYWHEIPGEENLTPEVYVKRSDDLL